MTPAKPWVLEALEAMGAPPQVKVWRQIASTGAWYTVEALPHVGEPWLYAYRYAERPH